jgi:hypothetical protein
MDDIRRSTSDSLRGKLGIPEDAERVLIFSESSHWDPNWMYTSEKYYDRFVRSNLDQAIDKLLQEPRRIYSIECIFFLRKYWDRCPTQRDKIRALVNDGRLRLTSSGVTTSDTLLPSAEAILRDFLIGQEWLRLNGMSQEPNLAYFSDSFGCSSALPSLLKAAGFDRTAITRIDGMYFMGCDLESSKGYPKPGSSAELLLNQERTLDFVWRDSNGAQVLCHWNAFTYGHGDLLAHVGLSRVYLIPIALPMRSDRHIARRIDQYAAQLSPYSRTPYMFCPIGFDFVEPIHGLVALLDRYNRNHHPTTGIWTVNAGLDDYMALVEGYQDDLPVLEIDPNPYWTGFYTARPGLKKKCRELIDALLLAEQLSLLPENQGAERTISKELEAAWYDAVVSNHHDFITGTSPDKVVEEEQIPWLDRAAASTQLIIDRLASRLSVGRATAQTSVLPEWKRHGSRILVKSAHYILELDEDAGGAVVSLQTTAGETLLLPGISNDLISYRDSGGLWRMGLEFWGGIWKKSVQASDRPSRLHVNERENDLEISCTNELNGELIRRLIWIRDDSPVIRCRVEGRAAEGYSVTVRLNSTLSASKLVMDTPGGLVTRPPKRIYDPTFWPFQQFVHIQDDGGGQGLAVFQTVPGAVAYQPNAGLELVALRNATREKVFGLIVIPGLPASGHEKTAYSFDYALMFTQSGDWRENDLPDIAQSIGNDLWDNAERELLYNFAVSAVTTDSANVRVVAIKPASRGKGIIVRLYTPALPESDVQLTAHHFTIESAFLCDARERDLGPLEVRDGTVLLTMPGTIATLRLLQV